MCLDYANDHIWKKIYSFVVVATTIAINIILKRVIIALEYWIGYRTESRVRVSILRKVFIV